MKAVGYLESLPIDNDNALIEREITRPEPGPLDLLVRVKAISVNPVDTKIRKSATSVVNGEMKILGWDVSGVVEKVGTKVSLFKPGDEVWYAGSITRPGCNCEFHLVDERIASLKPLKLSHEEAAAMPLTTITAWECLFDRLNILVNDRKEILIFGGAGGVGSMAIQLAKKQTHLKVIATASRQASIEWCKKMGADLVVDHTMDIQEQLRSHGIKEVKYILSLTHSEEHKPTMEKIIAPEGHICLIDDVKSFDITPFKKKAVSIHWESMFTRSTYEIPDMIKQHQLLQSVAAMVDQGQIIPTINHLFENFTAENLRKAHKMIESGHTIGKIVVKF